MEDAKCQAVDESMAGGQLGGAAVGKSVAGETWNDPASDD
jgi:hypothetical protein